MKVKLAIGVLTTIILGLGLACSGGEPTPVPTIPEPQTPAETNATLIPTALPTSTLIPTPTTVPVPTSISVAPPAPTPIPPATAEPLTPPTAVSMPEQVDLRTLDDDLVQLGIAIGNLPDSGLLGAVLSSQAVAADANEITVSVDGVEYCNPVEVAADLGLYRLGCGNSAKNHYEVQEVSVSVRNQGEMRCDRHKESELTFTLFACIWDTDTEGNPIPFEMPTSTPTPLPTDTPTPEPTTNTPTPTEMPTPTVTPTPELASQIAPTSVSAPAPAPTAAPAPAPITLGLSRENPWPMDGTCVGPEDGFCFSIVSVNRDADIDSELRDNHKFVVIEINALNQSAELLDSSAVYYYFTVIGEGKNVDISQGDNGGCGRQTVPNLMEAGIDIYPGDSISGNLCFVVHEEDIDTLVLEWFDDLPVLWYALH